MDYRTLHMKTVAELRQLAKELHVKIPAGTTKAVLTQMLTEAYAREETVTDTVPAENNAAAEAETDTVPAENNAAAEAATDTAPAENNAAAEAATDTVPAENNAAAEAETDTVPAENNAAAEAATVACPAGEQSQKAAPSEGEAVAAKRPCRRKAAAETSAEEAPQSDSEKAAAAEGSNEATESAPSDKPADFVRRPYTPVQQRMGARAQVTPAAHGRSAQRIFQSTGRSMAHTQERPTANRADTVRAPRAGHPAENTPGRRTAHPGQSENRTIRRSPAENGAENTARVSENRAYRPAEAAARTGSSENRAFRRSPAENGAENAARSSENRAYRPAEAAARTGVSENRPYRPMEAASEGRAYRPVEAAIENRGARMAENPSENRAYQSPENRAYRPEGSAEGNPQEASSEQEGFKVRRESVYTAEYGTINPAVPELLAAGDCADGAGVLEIHPEGYGFLRASNYLPGSGDTYVSIAQIRRFNLRTGDYVTGKTRPQREGDRYNAMLYISEVNGLSPDENARRAPFDSLIPVYPDERFRLEPKDGKNDLALRIIDILAPIGKGQRGLIVSQPKAGKTTLLKKIANAITENNPEVHLIVLLIDERPEEVTDMKRSISGEVVYSTFDEAPENHTRVSEMVLERAQRLVEQGKDVVILLDSITRLARAYNLVIPPTGRSLSGGLDPGALYKPKRFLGAARNIEGGGSLTIIATALVDTGSRMDDIIFEEFKGTGNMELHLDRKLSERRIFPAIDLYKSGTRREELLLSPEELEGEYQVRKMLGSGGNQEAAEQLIGLLEKTSRNDEFFSRLKGWIAAFEKDGFSIAPKR